MSGHEISRHWRLKQQRYRLVGKVCPDCGAKLFPPRGVCPECKSWPDEKPTRIEDGDVFEPRTRQPVMITENR